MHEVTINGFRLTQMQCQNLIKVIHTTDYMENEDIEILLAMFDINDSDAPPSISDKVAAMLLRMAAVILFSFVVIGVMFVVTLLRKGL